MKLQHLNLKRRDLQKVSFALLTTRNSYQLHGSATKDNEKCERFYSRT